MHRQAHEEGLHVVDEGDDGDAGAAEEAAEPAVGDPDLDSLCDGFVDAFNDRDLELLLTLTADDVDVPDVPGEDGPDVLADEVCAIWERSPGAILTRGSWEGRPCAVAWLPDDEGGWVRAGLWLFEADDGLLTVAACPDDPDALESADAEDPTGEELEEWRDWGEWESGAETPAVQPGQR
jgi:hypothetical protein